MLFQNPRTINKSTIKPITMQNFIQNPYPPSKPPEHEKIIKPKPTWENQHRKMSNLETSNPEHELHSSCFSSNQDKPNWLTHSKSISAQKIHTHELKPPPTTNQNWNHHQQPKQPPQSPTPPNTTTTNHHQKPSAESQTQTQTKSKIHTKTQNTKTKSKTQTIRHHCHHHHHHHHQHPPLPNPYPQTQIIKIKTKNNKNTKPNQIYFLP